MPIIKMLENVKIKAVFKTLYTVNNNKISLGKNIYFYYTCNTAREMLAEQVKI